MVSFVIPFCVQHPIRLIMFLWLPILFIVFISDTRSASSSSVASSKKKVVSSFLSIYHVIYCTTQLNGH